MSNEPLIRVESLVKHFEVGGSAFSRLFGGDDEYVHAVDGIDLSIYPGEKFGLVGESGCGKTTTARVFSGLEKPTAGKFFWRNLEIDYEDLKPSKADVKSQFVFQDPYSSLNPRMKVGEATQHPLVIQDKISQPQVKRTLKLAYYSEIISALAFIISLGLYIYTFITPSLYYTRVATIGAIASFAIGLFLYIYFARYRKNQILDKDVLELFDRVGLTPPEQYYFKHPHELSGGERQRVNIARSVILKPNLLILDEPTSMLDVSLRAGILDLLEKIRTEFNISFLFITHDLATARHFCDRVGVMYIGEIVEKGETNALFRNPIHPYTKSLVDAIPSPSRLKKEKLVPKGDVADAINPPVGCRFHPRCPFAEQKCIDIKPKLEEIKPKRWVACHFPLIEE